MLILSSSLSPATSANAMIPRAGGPVGIIIMLNQRMGSESRMLVLDAMAHIMGILILGPVL